MLTILAILIKLVLYVSGLTVIGLCLHWVFRIVGHEYRTPDYLATAGLVFAGAVVLKLLIANAQLAGSLSGAFSADAFKWVWRPHAVQTCLFLGAVLVLIATTVRKWRPGAIAVVLGVAGGFGMAGHTQGLDQAMFWGLIVGLHVAIAGFWFVAPLTLYPKETSSMGEIQHRTSTFSLIAVRVVPVLFVSGILVLWQLLDSLRDLYATPYGRLLGLKFLAATILLGLGAMNKFWISEKLAQNLTSGRVMLRRILLGEGAVFASLLLLLALATTVTGPGHSH